MSGIVPDLYLAAESLGRIDVDHPSHSCPGKGKEQSEWDAEKMLAAGRISKFSRVRAPFIEPPSEKVFFLKTALVDGMISES